MVGRKLSCGVAGGVVDHTDDGSLLCPQMHSDTLGSVSLSLQCFQITVHSDLEILLVDSELETFIEVMTV